MGALISFAVSLGVFIAFFWCLDALRTLKDGQLEILKRLERLESSQRDRTAAEIPEDEHALPVR